MPLLPAHACAEPGCPETTRRGARCDQHAKARAAEANSLRPSAAQRGYRAGWRRLRAWYVARHPLCVECTRLGLPHDPHALLEVDHVDGDVTNCALTNLQTLCKRHHSQKTSRENGGGWRRRTTR